MAAAEMAESLQRVGEQSPELSVEERISMSMMSRRQEAMNQKEGKTVEVPQIQYQEVNRHATVPKVVTQEVVRQVYVPQPYPEYVDVPRASLIVQTTQKTMEIPQVPQVQFLDRMDGIPRTVPHDRIPQQTAEQISDAQITGELVEGFNVFSQSRVQQQIVEPIVETPAVSLADIVEASKAQMQEEITYCLKEDQSEFLEELIIEKSDVPVPRVTEKTIEVVKLIPQEQTQNRTVRQITDVPVPRVMMEENTEVEMLKLTSKLDSGCAAQAPEWKEPRRLRAEELVTIRDVNKLPNDSDNLELFKETLPSPIMMQVQSDKRGVASRDVAKVISMTKDAVSLLQQEQDDNDITQQVQKQQQFWHSNHSKQAMQRREGKEEKGQEERERGRKGEGERGQAGRKKEEEKEAVGERGKQVEKDVMD